MTIDIPEELLRQAKARAAQRGIQLKDLLAEALQESLFLCEQPTKRQADSEEEKGLQVLQVLDPSCVFPLIRGACGPALPSLTNETIGRILEEEEVRRALGSG